MWSMPVIWDRLQSLFDFSSGIQEYFLRINSWKRHCVCVLSHSPGAGATWVTAGRSCAAVAVVPCCHGKMPCPCAGDLLVAPTLHVCDEDVGPVKGGAWGPCWPWAYAKGKQKDFCQDPRHSGGLSGWLSGIYSVCKCRRHGLDPWSRMAPLALEQLAVSLFSQAWEPQLLKPTQPRARALRQEKPLQWDARHRGWKAAPSHQS